MKNYFLFLLLLLVGCAGRTSNADPGPAERIVCTSTSHVAFLRELGEEARIVEYQRTIDVERIVSLKPDLVLLSWEADGERLRELGVRCVAVEEWLEPTPLGRASWIVKIAELCGEREKGVEKFSEIQRAYNDLVARAAEISAGSTASVRPRVLLNAPYRGVWWVPRDGGYMVRLVEDAGGEVILKGVRNTAASSFESAAAVPVEIEQAWLAMQGADAWLNVNEYTSMAELLADNPRFADSPPVVAGRVFNNIAREGSDGGSDFWESGVVRPDRVLADLIAILHPESGVYTLYHYKQLR